MQSRVEICRDRHNRRSCKISASCVNFSGKQCNISHNLRTTTRFTHTKGDFALELLKFYTLGKIALHLLFGWSLDKDKKKVWINPNNSHESLDRSKLRPSQTPTIHPSEFFGHITFSVPNIKL